MAGNSVVINVIARVKGLPEVEGLKSKLNNLTTSKGFKQAALGFGISAGMTAWNALGDAAQGAIQWLGDGINVASDLSEAMSKSQVVFGDAAGAIDDFAETSARSFGLSQRAAYDATGQFGNLFTTMGLASGEAARMSVDITKLAADLASFHNISVDDALVKLRSGLVGEAEPMRTLGVLLSAAAVEAKALEMGLAKTKAEITESDKVMARYAIIMEQTSAAQGDFDRTSDGLANTQRTLTAQMEDLQAAIGEKLLPIMLELANALNDDVLPAIQDLIDTAEENTWVFDGLGKAAGLLATPITAVTDNVGRAQHGIAALNGDAAAAQRLFESLPFGLGKTQAEALSLAAGLRTAGGGFWTLARSADTAQGELGGIKISAKDAGNAIRGLWRDIKNPLRSARDNTLSTAFDAKRLPIEINQAKRDVRAARKDLEEAQTNEQKDAAKIRILDAQQNLEELRNKSRDFKADYGATGKALGDAIGGSMYRSILRWIELSRGALGSFPSTVPVPGGGAKTKPGGRGSDTGSLIPGAGRASGGPVSPGGLYMVGERGPELFVPQSAGYIVPNGAGGRGPAITVPVYVTSTVSVRAVNDAQRVDAAYNGRTVDR